MSDWPRPGTFFFERMDRSWKNDYLRLREEGLSHEEAAFEASELAEPADVPGWGPESDQTPMTQYSSNPIGFSTLAIGGLLAAGALLLFRGRAAASPACPIDDKTLNAWGKATKRIIVHTTYRNPPSLENVQITWADIIAKAPDGARITVVTSDGRFWEYRGGAPRAAPGVKQTYCDYRRER